ncbi:MAG: ADP-dependent glucokinase/phosphofructokinase [Lachnospiraceae bacterium]|nr:ADP-dependent glucokinase/phosphofructokinase [Lachnospiraceae bacterium]
MNHYSDRYAECLASVEEDARYSRETGRFPVLGFTSNYDVVLRWDAGTYRKAIGKYLQGVPEAKNGDTISDLKDLARITSCYMMQGLGGSFMIESREVCDYLLEHFSTEYALGGTGAQGAAALGTLGYPVGIHVTDLSREVCTFLNHEGTTVIRNGALTDISEAAEDVLPSYNFIMQFDAGDELSIDGKTVAIPNSNRLILFFGNMLPTVPLRKDFFDYWILPENTPSSLLVSGFDAIVIPELAREKLDTLVPFLKTTRKVHPETVIYLEGAFYMSSATKDLLFEEVSPFADIIGMNEEELADQAKRLGVTVDIDLTKDVLRGLEAILKRFPAGGIILHTRDYSMYYGKELKGIDIEKGLTMGNLMSGTRARVGHYGTREECAETLSLPLSEKGLKFHEEASSLAGERFVKAVPSRLLEKPKYTIGLGDTFVAGVHTSFIRRI